MPGMGANPFDTDEDLLDVASRAPGPAGALPLTPEMLRNAPSGNLFGWSQNAGMGWAAVGARREGVPDPLDARRRARA